MHQSLLPDTKRSKTAHASAQLFHSHDVSCFVTIRDLLSIAMSVCRVSKCHIIPTVEPRYPSLLPSKTPLKQLRHYPALALKCPSKISKLTCNSIHQEPIQVPLHLHIPTNLPLVQHNIHPRPNALHMANELQPPPRQPLHKHILNIPALQAPIIQPHLVGRLVGHNRSLESLRRTV